MSLTHVLFDLQNDYNISFSFSPNTTDNCVVNLNDTFENIELAIQKLCEPCNLEAKNINNVFIIVEHEMPHLEIKSEKIKYIYKIHISENQSDEELGLSKLKIDNRYYLADINGNFSFTSMSKMLALEVSHLGYIKKDTIINYSTTRHSIELVPFSENLKIVEVTDQQTIEHVSIGKKPGKLSVNSESSGFLAGESNNAIFNTLRLQPGILSAGEQASDYVIWNSYKGQNQLIFDGITLFKANTYNQTISGINSNIIKTIDIYKGGYNADIGDRVGGVIDIKSKTGSFSKFQTICNLNNQLANCYFNIPFKSKANLQVGLRQSFDNPFQLNFKKIYIHPETKFTDANLKFSTLIKGTNPLKISFIINNDFYEETLLDKLDNPLASISNTSKQSGLSLYYGKNWKHGDLTDITISRSMLSTKFTNSFESMEFNSTNNSITEQSLKLSHLFKVNQKHQFKTGVNLINNVSLFRNDSSSYNFKNSTESIVRLNAYFTDNWHLSEKITLNYGLKVETPILFKKIVIQPRLNFKYKPSNIINIYTSWGIYTQFMSELAILDQYQNNLFHWSIINEKSLPNQSNHYVLGISLIKNKWKLSSEGFYKNTANLLTFYAKDIENIALTSGVAKTYGLDFLISRTFKKHNLWVAYTVSQSEDYFKHYDDNNWRPAQQNQRHELKTAFVFNFDPIHFSINYVYGSGLTYLKTNGEQFKLSYNRLDMALKYEFNMKRLKMETGLSILNVLNNKNLQLNSFNNFPESENRFILSTPFTPMLFIKMKF